MFSQAARRNLPGMVHRSTPQSCVFFTLGRPVPATHQAWCFGYLTDFFLDHVETLAHRRLAEAYQAWCTGHLPRVALSLPSVVRSPEATGHILGKKSRCKQRRRAIMICHHQNRCFPSWAPPWPFQDGSGWLRTIPGQLNRLLVERCHKPLEQPNQHARHGPTGTQVRCQVEQDLPTYSFSICLTHTQAAEPSYHMIRQPHVWDKAAKRSRLIYYVATMRVGAPVRRVVHIQG